jgi:hypothetical protein
MELAALAMTAAALLARSFIEAAGANAGQEVWAGAKHLYAAVKERFTGDSPAEGSLRALKEDPQSKTSQQALADSIVAKAEQDDVFRTLLEKLITEAARDESTAGVVNQFMGDVRIGKQVNIGGDVETVNL